MKTLHLEKHGLRGLAIAESFLQNSKKSILAGPCYNIRFNY